MPWADRDWHLVKRQRSIYGTTAQVVPERGEFIGTKLGPEHSDAEQRADAHKQYQRIIDQATSDPAKLEGYHVEGGWRRARNYWLLLPTDQRTPQPLALGIAFDVFVPEQRQRAAVARVS
jgi:hypothetical protein